MAICECAPHCGCPNEATTVDKWGANVCAECNAAENRSEYSDGSFRCLRTDPKPTLARGRIFPDPATRLECL